MTAFNTLPGFPIRTSPGHSSLDNSPELFAACYVLLRLSTPRHPPSALHSLISIPLLQSLRAVKKLKIFLRILSNPLFRHLIYLEQISRFTRPYSLSLSSILFSKTNGGFNSQPVSEAALYAGWMWVSRFFYYFCPFFQNCHIY